MFSCLLALYKVFLIFYKFVLQIFPKIEQTILLSNKNYFLKSSSASADQTNS